MTDARDPKLADLRAVQTTGPAARGKRMYQGLSASSAGLELGIAVALGALFGRWLDTEAGTQPWLMLLFMMFGLIAGFRGLLRAVARAEKADG